MYRQLSPAATTDFHLLRLEQAKAAYVPCAGIAQENDMLFDQERRWCCPSAERVTEPHGMPG